MMIAFITFNSSLVPMIEGLCSSDPWKFEQFLLFFGCYVATQLACQLHQERTQVVCSNKEARKRLARRHSSNGLWTHECCSEVDVFLFWEYI